MNSFDFIKEHLSNFITLFPKTKVSYEFDYDCNTHYIEVVPNSIYHLDAAYIKWENDFFEIFTAEFPEHNICFISDDALVGLDKVDFKIIGKDFQQNYNVKSSIHVNELKNFIVSVFDHRQTMESGVIVNAYNSDTNYNNSMISKTNNLAYNTNSSQIKVVSPSNEKFTFNETILQAA